MGRGDGRATPQARGFPPRYVLVRICSGFAARCNAFSSTPARRRPCRSPVQAGLQSPPCVGSPLKTHLSFSRISCRRNPPCVHLEYLLDPEVCEDPLVFTDHWPGKVESTRVRRQGNDVMKPREDEQARPRAHDPGVRIPRLLISEPFSESRCFFRVPSASSHLCCRRSRRGGT